MRNRKGSTESAQRCLSPFHHFQSIPRFPVLITILILMVIKQGNAQALL